MLLKLNEIICFCDGASSGNPGPGGWGCVLVFPDERIVELGGHESPVTNNQMELEAAIQCLMKAPSHESLSIVTDSSYLQQGATAWVKKWQHSDWKTASGSAVANRDRWERLVNLISSRGAAIHWHLVPGHRGVFGNDRADEIAVAFSKGASRSLYSGPAHNYSIPLSELLNLETHSFSEKKASKKRSRAKAHCYLSLLGGILERHLTWEECEKRVKGQPGAKFKKALTPQEEAKIIEEWRVFKK